MPQFTTVECQRLTECAENILLVRAELGGTLAELYEASKMPEALRIAHEENDAVLEEIYSGRPFRSDIDRLNHLFRRYARWSAENAEQPMDCDAEFDFDAED